jgi:L-alanine-DL-glutamate epimerase-like enolase superfamily enzyme
MKITRITLSVYRWERAQPITNGLHTYSGVSLSAVKIETDAGVMGMGTGGSKRGQREFLLQFAQRIIGADPRFTEALWAKNWSPKQFGRRGFETRALSVLDLACWDLKGRLAGLPVHFLLGGFRTRIPTYVAGGYYAEGKGLKDLAAEMVGYVERGARAVKMKVGAVPIRDDVERVKAVRAAIGPDVKLMIDANCAYRAYQAIELARRVEEHDVFWFEEPVQPDDYDGFRRIAAMSSVPLATGENEYTKHGFRDLIETRAVPILQPDARNMGGITEFMKVAAMAQAHGLDICPHGDQQCHLSLMAAIPNALFLEYYPKEFDPMHGQTYLHTPEINADGTVTVPDVPGTGCEVNEAAMAPFKVLEFVIDAGGVSQTGGLSGAME